MNELEILFSEGSESELNLDKITVELTRFCCKF